MKRKASAAERLIKRLHSKYREDLEDLWNAIEESKYELAELRQLRATNQALSVRLDALLPVLEHLAEVLQPGPEVDVNGLYDLPSLCGTPKEEP